MFKENNLDKERKPQISIQFGLGGHEDEYIIQIRPGGTYSDPIDIPDDWGQTFEKKLGKEWYVMNRGQRFEIKPPIIGNLKSSFSERKRTEETDAAIKEIISDLIGPEYEIRFY